MYSILPLTEDRSLLSLTKWRREKNKEDKKGNMVLSELGSKLQGALAQLNRTTVVDDEVFSAILKDICGALLESDVQVKLVRQLRDNVKLAVNLEDGASGANRRRLIQKAVVDQLVQMLEPEAKPYKLRKGHNNVVMFVGLQGSGKTTSIAKYAHFYQRKGWKTCMVCADTFRAGAFDQLKQNATKLRIPFYGSYTEADPVRIAEEGVAQFRAENYELILVDTSGRHKQEADLFAEMREVATAVKPDDVVFVMDSTIGQAVFDQASAFRQTVDVGSVIITKLDGHAKGGGALSAVAATGSPIIFYGEGEHFSDFESFNAQSFVSRLMGMGDIRGLMEEVKTSGMLDNQEEMVQKFQKGVFTLRDMYKQFQSVMKMGPLSKVMSMIPGMQGMSQMMNSVGGGEEETSKRLRRFLFMMDSMTDAELDGLVQLTPTRQTRIARGSGCQIYEVDFLIKCHKQFATVVSRMGKSGLMKTGDAALGKQMARNPNAVMQQLSKAMDPKMMAQMGGPQNMMRMMQQMRNMDPSAMGDMAKMAAGMGMKMPF
jgi:signal recognition particle subunit SRP54